MKEEVLIVGTSLPMIDTVTLFSKHKPSLNSTGDMDVEVRLCVENSPKSDAK